MKTAKCAVRGLPRFRGEADLYVLSEPYKYEDSETRYVVSSAINNEFGRETLVFPADKDGKVLSWDEIGGGRGYMDTAAAVAELGYTVV